MPHFLANGDIVRLELYCQNSTQRSINRLKFRVRNTVGISITDQLAVDEFSTLLGPSMRDWMSASSQYLGARFQIERLTRRPYTSSINSAGNGSIAGVDALPPQASGIVKWFTALTGKTERGRVYLPFLAASLLAGDGSVTGPGQTLMEAFANAFFPPVTIADGLGNHAEFVLGVDSDGSPTSVPPIPAHFSDVTGFQVGTRFATQRRRSLVNKGDSFGP